MLKQLNKPYITIVDFNSKNIHNIIVSKNIDYILPLSERDFLTIKKYRKYDGMILYPNAKIVELLHNKLRFTEFMLKHFPECIPTTYYANNIKLLDPEYPVISKPVFSTNGNDIKIFHNENEFSECKNRIIIQKFIENEYEYSAYMLCIDGKINNWKIIRYKYTKFTIKKENFPHDYENVENMNILDACKRIIATLNYTGGICFDLKFDEGSNKIDIFEINPRFGGSAFTCKFIDHLLSISTHVDNLQYRIQSNTCKNVRFLMR